MKTFPSLQFICGGIAYAINLLDISGGGVLPASLQCLALLYISTYLPFLQAW